MTARTDGIDIGTLDEAAWPEWHRLIAQGFGGHPAPEVDAAEQAVLDRDRATVAVDGDQLVGTCGSYAFGVVVPGGAVVPSCAVTNVVVRTTHRRRGVLRSMLVPHLAAARDRGEVLAVLNASEAGIYGRFGFGEASRYVVRSLPTSVAFAHPPVDRPLRQVPQDEAAPVLAERYRAALGRRPGTVDRPDRWWDLLLGPAEMWKGGGKLFVVVLDPVDGLGGGYVVYGLRQQEGVGGVVDVRELVADTPEAEARLWRYCCDVDLAHQVRAEVPVDDPLPLRLADPRACRTEELRDYLWVRLLDVPAALSVRAYSAPVDVVVEVAGGGEPEVAGRYRLVATPEGGAACEPSTAEADLVLGLDALGAAYLGGTSLVALGAADRVEERTPGALAAADAAFSSPVAPFCATRF